MNDTTKREGLSPLWAAGLAVSAVTAALLIGGRASPTPDHPKTRRWYRRLSKPGFTPPSPVYAVAWTGIQASMAYGGYRLLRAEPSSRRTTALSLWGANQIGIAGWSEVFFGQRSPGWGTIASAALGGTAVGYVASANPVDRTAARLGVPLAAWVGFATLLSEEIWRLNDAPADAGKA
jgi:benzodiazapine receptor